MGSICFVPIVQALAPCPSGRLLCGHRACLSRTLYGQLGSLMKLYPGTLCVPFYIFIIADQARKNKLKLIISSYFIYRFLESVAYMRTCSVKRQRLPVFRHQIPSFAVSGTRNGRPGISKKQPICPFSASQGSIRNVLPAYKTRIVALRICLISIKRLHRFFN